MPDNRKYVEIIEDTFLSKAWAYTVMYHGVAIGLWVDNALKFHESAEFDWKHVAELRVFNTERELRFVRGENNMLLVRKRIGDELIAGDGSVIMYDDIRDCEYMMYGTDKHDDAEWTVLTEDRGGNVCFPKPLEFSNNEIVMWLGIRNYLRFTDDPPRLEVCDYVFTGFKQGKNKKEVLP